MRQAVCRHDALLLATGLHHAHVTHPVVFGALVINRRFRKPSGRTTEREATRSQEAAAATAGSSEFFEPTTNAAVGRPEEGQRGYLGFGKKGRSMPLNPLLVLNKVDDPATKKVLNAVQKLKNSPESMQISEDQQQQVVNAYASTRWYAKLWRPLQSLDYSYMRRWYYFCTFLFTVCFIGLLICVMILYRNELLAFQFLTEEEQQAYHDIVMGIRYSEIYATSMKLLREVDPLQVLPHEVRLQLAVREMMKLGWHKNDWEQVRRERYRNSPWKDRDFVHLAFWGIMAFGSSCNGTGTYYPASFADVEIESKRRNMQRANELRSNVAFGPEPQAPAAHH